MYKTFDFKVASIILKWKKFGTTKTPQTPSRLAKVSNWVALVRVTLTVSDSPVFAKGLSDHEKQDSLV
jgi:hypothetical protein